MPQATVRKGVSSWPLRLTIGWTLAAAACAGHLERPRLSPAQIRSISAATRFEELFEVEKTVPIQAQGDFELSFQPFIKAVSRRSELLILDRINVRNVFVFDAQGRPVGRIGIEGRGASGHVFPRDLFYDRQADIYYLYDSDVLRLYRYSPDLLFIDSITVPVRADRILVSPERRTYLYTPLMATANGTGHAVYEVDDGGRILRRFGKKPRAYSPWSASEMGGITLIGETLYLATPYEYSIRAFSLDGKELRSRRYRSAHYTPPPEPPIVESETNLKEAMIRYHERWSHLRQILDFDDRMIGIVYSPPAQASSLLSLFDLDLNLLARDLPLPPYVGDILAQGDRLHLLRSSHLLAGGPRDWEWVQYRLRLPNSSPLEESAP